MKRFLVLFLCVLMICSISMVFAADEAEGTDVAPATTDAEPAPAAEEPAAIADEPAADADTEDDFPYEWWNNAFPNDNHFGFVRFVEDSKTHEKYERLTNDDYVNDYPVKAGESVELVVPEPVGDDLEGLTYKWSMEHFDPETETSSSKELDSVTYTVTTDPMPGNGFVTCRCTITDKFGNEAIYSYFITVIRYEIDPEEAEYVKGSGKDLVFTITSYVEDENLLDSITSIQFWAFTGEFITFEDDDEQYPEYDETDLSLDHISEDGKTITITLPAEFLDEFDESEYPCYLDVYRDELYLFGARINIVEPIADTDDVTDTALYAVIAATSLVAITAVVIGKKKLSVR